MFSCLFYGHANSYENKYLKNTSVRLFFNVNYVKIGKKALIRRLKIAQKSERDLVSKFIHFGHFRSVLRRRRLKNVFIWLWSLFANCEKSEQNRTWASSAQPTPLPPDDARTVRKIRLGGCRKKFSVYVVEIIELEEKCFEWNFEEMYPWKERNFGLKREYNPRRHLSVKKIYKGRRKYREIIWKKLFSLISVPLKRNYIFQREEISLDKNYYLL